MAAINTYHDHHGHGRSSSNRAVAMALALISAIVLSPVYITSNKDFKNHHYYDQTRWSFSGFVLPMVLAGLIIAIKTTSSSTSPSSSNPSTMSSPRRRMDSNSRDFAHDPSWVHRIGGSSLGLSGILVMLIVVISWQHSIQHYLWR